MKEPDYVIIILQIVIMYKFYRQIVNNVTHIRCGFKRLRDDSMKFYSYDFIIYSRCFLCINHHSFVTIKFRNREIVYKICKHKKNFFRLEDGVVFLKLSISSFKTFEVIVKVKSLRFK